MSSSTSYSPAPPAAPPATLPSFSFAALPASSTELRGWTRWLGEEIAAGRIAAVSHQLGALARAARLRQLELVCCDVLADVAQPGIARARAFARVVAALIGAGFVERPGEQAEVAA